MRFTKSTLEKLPPAAPGCRDTYYDDVVRGLQLRVTAKGQKTFVVRRRICGHDERITLGIFPQMTIEQARKSAETTNGAIASKQNPAAVRRSLRGELTFEEVFESFLKKKRNRSGKPLATATLESYRVTVKEHLRGILNLKLSQITPDRLRGLRIKSDAQNNRVRAIISSVFNWAEAEGLTSLANPAKAIKNRFIKSRSRFLQPHELPKFLAALEQSSLCDFFTICLLTGARKSNVLAMRWQDINLAEAVWVIPQTKNGESQIVPLPTQAIHVLKAREQTKVLDAEWVFPGNGKTGHLVEPKRAWANILKCAGLDEHLRIHDLRRTLGSWQARAGASLPIIGKSLGHKSMQSTLVYSRLDLVPVRESMENAVSSILDAGSSERFNRIPQSEPISELASEVPDPDA